MNHAHDLHASECLFRPAAPVAVGHTDMTSAYDSGTFLLPEGNSPHEKSSLTDTGDSSGCRAGVIQHDGETSQSARFRETMCPKIKIFPFQTQGGSTRRPGFRKTQFLLAEWSTKSKQHRALIFIKFKLHRTLHNRQLILYRTGIQSGPTQVPDGETEHADNGHANEFLRADVARQK